MWTALRWVWPCTIRSTGMRSPRRRSRLHTASDEVVIDASQMAPQWAPASDRPNSVLGAVIIS